MPFIRVLPVSVVADDDNNNNTNKSISKYKMDYLYSAETCVAILS